MLPASKKISDQAAVFIEEIINGKNQTQAAKNAGYAHPAQSGHVLMKSPGIVARIRQERQKLFQTDLANCATSTLKEIVLDKDAAPSARIQGCRTILEVCNMLGKHSTKDSDSKALHEMTPAQLAGLIDTLETAKIDAAKPVNVNPEANKE